MHKQFLSAKIHRATVTHADLHYDGSVSIDATLMDASGIQPYEVVHIWNVNNGNRLTTYAIPADPDSGVICINGAAAHRMHRGDLVIISAFVGLEAREIPDHRPTVVLVDGENRIREVCHDVVGGPAFASPPSSG